MTQEDKELLLIDLCARLPYGVKCHVPTKDKAMTLTGKRLNYFCFHDERCGVDYNHEYEVVLDPLNDAHNGYIIKPYLRPLSSMTEEEKRYLMSLKYQPSAFKWKNLIISSQEIIDWLNAHHFDYRGLIEKGLAIEVTEENNPYKDNKI